MAFEDEMKATGHFDLVSWVLSNETYDQSRKIYIDVEDPDRAYTAAEARTTIRKLIAGFKSIGLKKGDCVCVHAFNSVIYPLLLLAIVGAGGVYTGSNPSYTSTEMARHLKSTGTRFMISDTDVLEKISESILYILPSSALFQIDSKGHQACPDTQSWQALLDHGEADWSTLASIDEAKQTTASLLSTSGTSGLPKAAMISHYNLIAQTGQLNDIEQKPYAVSRLVANPVFHGFAFPLAHTLPLWQGTPTYIMRRFDIDKFLTYIPKYEITETTMVPTIIVNILKRPFKAFRDLRSLRTVWSAGSPLLQTTQNELFRLMRPTARLIQCWGMTEAGWIATFLWPEKDHSGSVGRLLAGMEAKIIADGKAVQEDLVQGEIYIRGPVVMQGYLNNPEATAATIDGDGWLRTGDIAYLEHGKIYIVDRKKELIKVRGWQISPAELEAQLVTHPKIREAAVVGIETTEGDTELPRAYVVRSPGGDVTETEAKDYMSVHLARYKSLEGGVRFVEELPKNAMGKIVRRELTQLAAVEEASQQKLTIDVNAVNLTDAAPQLSATTTGSATSESDWQRLQSSTQPSSVTPSLATDSASVSDADDSHEHTVLTLDMGHTVNDTDHLSEKPRGGAVQKVDPLTETDELPMMLDSTHLDV